MVLCTAGNKRGKFFTKTHIKYEINEKYLSYSNNFVSVKTHSLELDYGQNLKSSTTKMKYVEDFIFMF